MRRSTRIWIVADPRSPVGLTNPSNLVLSVGDVTFQLFTANENAFLGRTILPDLTLTGGYQTHRSIGQFEANANPTALQTLNNFANGIDTQLLISGCACGPHCSATG